MIKEIRTTDAELRVDPTDDNAVEGYAAVFNSFSQDLGGFREIIRPGAFKDSIANGDDIRCLVDHDDAKMLGRTSSHTVRVWEDQKGLPFRVQLPDTSYARDLRALMKRGDVTKCSFAFTVNDNGEQWRKEGEQVIRELHSAKLYDVSVVTSYPAYDATSAALRSYEEFIAANNTNNSTKENNSDCRKIISLHLCKQIQIEKELTL